MSVKGAIKPEKAVNDRLCNAHDRSGSSAGRGLELSQRLTGVELARGRPIF